MPQVAARYEETSRWLQPTIVERGVSIGANATILPGIRLGRYSMIAAGSVVTSDVPPFGIVVGSPARVVGDVCRCGQRLAGTYLTTVCMACGETPESRLQLSEKEAIAT
jgi:acetyltransferase-like isoleucine patch superfamily enzyme